MRQKRQKRKFNYPELGYLYHVTDLYYLPELSQKGLEIKEQTSSKTNFYGFPKFANFLTTPEGVDFWFQNMTFKYDYLIVLRVEDYKNCTKDFLGTNDSEELALHCTENIEPKFLKYWNGIKWKSLINLDNDEYQVLKELAIEDKYLLLPPETALEEEYVNWRDVDIYY